MLDGWLTCVVADRLDVIMVGWMGAQDRLPADLPVDRRGGCSFRASAQAPGKGGLVLACRLTCAFAPCLERGALLVVFPTSWRSAGWRFFDPGGRPGPGLPGFDAPAGRLGCFRADVPKPPADTCRGEPPRGGGAFPGAAQVSGQRPGEAQLGMTGEDQPVGCQKSAWPMSCSDAPGSAAGHDDQSCLSVCPI